jgi:hypothetical protein
MSEAHLRLPFKARVAIDRAVIRPRNGSRPDQSVSKALVVAFLVVVRHVPFQGMPERCLPDKDHSIPGVSL